MSYLNVILVNKLTIGLYNNDYDNGSIIIQFLNQYFFNIFLFNCLIDFIFYYSNNFFQNF